MQTNLKTRTRMLILNSYMKTFVLTFKFLNLGPVYIYSGQNYQETRLETLIIKKLSILYDLYKASIFNVVTTTLTDLE